jgi:probable addiction module antidote protein
MTEKKIYKDIEALKSPEVAIAYLQKALERFAAEGDAKTFLAALRKLTKAQGGMTALSRRTGINRQNLYRTFASTGNPKFKSLGTILKGLGYNLAIQPVQQTEKIKQEIDSTIEKIIANTNVEEELA